MKKLLLILLIFFTVACDYSNVSEEAKNEYINKKEELTKKEEFENIDNIPFDITISLDRINEEEITYRVIIDNAKEDISNIKALLIHDYFTEDIFPSIGILFPSIGILDDTINLKHNAENEEKGFMLVGYINTKDPLEKLKIEFRLLVEYTDTEKKEHKIYYKTTNFS